MNSKHQPPAHSDSKQIELPSTIIRKIQREANKAGAADVLMHSPLAGLMIGLGVDAVRKASKLGDEKATSEAKHHLLGHVALEIAILGAAFYHEMKDTREELTELYEHEYPRSEKRMASVDELPEKDKKQIIYNKLGATFSALLFTTIGAYVAKDLIKDHEAFQGMNDAAKQLDDALPRIFEKSSLPLAAGGVAALATALLYGRNAKQEAVDRINDVREDLSNAKKAEKMMRLEEQETALIR